MNIISLPMQIRQASFTPATINAERRTVDLIWTTGATVKRYDSWTDQVFYEELVVSGADLSRLNAGASVLNSHANQNLNDVVGVVERAWINKDKTLGLATVRFSERTEVDPIWKDVQDGIIKHVSIGYSIDAAEHIKAEPRGSGPDTLRVTRFTPTEISLVPIAFDAGAQIRNYPTTIFPCNLSEVSKMADETKEVAETSTVFPDIQLVRREHEKAKALGAREALIAERKRITDLDELFDMAIWPKDEIWSDLRKRAIDEGWQSEATRKYLLDLLNSQAEPVFDHTAAIVSDSDMGMHHVPPPVPASHPVRSRPPMVPSNAGWSHRPLGRVEITRDAIDTTRSSIEQAILIRCGLEPDKKVEQEARERGFAGLTYIEMGRKLFEASGQQQRMMGLDKHGIAKIMLTRDGAGPMTASDFTGILANVATKVAKKGYLETPTTYQEWCNIAYLPDFKPATIPGLGAFSDLDTIPTSGGPYYYGTFGDNYETATLATYGKLFGISRHALVNDDLNLFSRTGMAMGAAAARKINSLAYTVLTSPSLVGQTMTETGLPLFHSTHANLVANGSGAAPSVTTLNTAEAAMMIQKSPKQTADSSTVYLNISPAHLIVPPALKATAMVLVESMWDPAGTTVSVSRRDSPNIWRGRLKVTCDPLVIPAEGWFLAAQQGNPVIDTVTVFFLEGSGAEPYTEEQPQFDSDGISYKVRIDAVARALDYRGLYFNDGN